MDKVQYGLNNVHYAVQTEIDGVISYGEMAPIPGAVNITNNPVGETAEFYADDMLYFSEDENNGYDGNLEIALIPDEFRTDVLGDTLDTNGVLIENKDAKPKKIALAFEFDGDVNKTRHVLYSVKVSRPSINGTTKTTSKTPQTSSMAYQARPRSDNGNIKAKALSTSDSYEDFFQTVYEPVLVTP